MDAKDLSSVDVPGSPVPPPALAIVGIGCMFPKSDCTEAFWANIKGGVDAVTDVPASHWKAEDYFDGDPSAPDMTYAKRGAFLEPVDFNPLEFGIAPNNLEAIDTTQLLGMVVAQQALRDAGYATGKDSGDGRAFNRDRCSVILGVTGALEMVIPLGARLGHPKWRKALEESGVEKSVADEVVKRIADSYVPWQENSFPGLLGNVAAGRIANRFDVGGTNCVVDAACASSLGALHMAAMELYAGRSDMAITGGIDTFNDIFMYMCFSKTPALSPTGSSRPFAAGGDGTILGEGLGVVVLKRLADAQRDGDRIHAVIRSIGSSSDGKGNAVYAPSSAGQVKCLLSAYGQAGISPATIELVEAHGTGTKVGDAVEAKALDQVYRAAKQEGTWCALGSVKSMVGHTKAAAGIAGLIKAALALEQKVLPPTIKVDRPLENLEGASALYVNTEKRPWVGRSEHPRRAGVSAFGFGGSNFHCVLEEARAEKLGVDWDDSVQVLAWSAGTREELAGKMAELEAGQSWKQLRETAAQTRADFRADAACRLVVVVQKQHSDLAKLLKSGTQMLKQHPELATWSTPDGVYFGAGKPGRLAVLFPGQGSQYVGMMRDLACAFPQMLDVLEAGNAAFGKAEHGERLSDRIYPVPVFTDAARAANEKLLADTRVAQPALGAVNAGTWEILRHFGVKAEAVGGHSFGEVVALWAAGRIDAAGLHRIACARGKAMADVAGGADAGGMLAVMMPLEDVKKFVAGEKLELIVANKNSPEQAVLSGRTGEIERAAKILEGRGVRARKLPVSAAFHSPLVAGAEGPFGAALKGIAFAAGDIPVFANATGDVYPAEEGEARELLASQLARPVEFVAQVERMYGNGVRTFVEVGPGGKLSGLVRAILGGREHHAIAVDASGGKRSGLFDLACAVGHLAALGHRVELTRWDEEFSRQPRGETKKPAMTVRLTGANYVKPRPAAAARKKIESTRAISAERAEVPQHQQEGSAPLGLRNTTSQGFVVSNTGSNGSAHVAPAITPIASPTAGSPALVQALQATQQSILSLQKMQEQTALVHQQYLQGQEAAQRTLHQLMEQQMMLLGSACGVSAPVLPPPTVTAVKHEVTKSTKVHEEVVVRGSEPAVIAPAPQWNASESKSENGNGFHSLGAIAVDAPDVAGSPARGPGLNGEVEKVLLEVVAEKTGYPVEMLELDMSLDADLGIDSIKRVEILSALQTQLPEAPVVKPEDLGRLQTLRQIVAFLGASAVADTPAGEPGPNGGEVEKVLLEVVAEKTGYPVEMLELDMSLDADLGIDSIKRVEILSALQTQLPEAPVVKPEDLGRLQTLRQIVAFLQGGMESPAAAKAATPPMPAPVAATHSNGHNNGNGHAKKDVLDRQVLTVVPLNGSLERERLAIAASAQLWITDDGAGLAGRICAALNVRKFDAKVVPITAAPTSAAIAGLLIVAPQNPSADFIRHAFEMIQRAGPKLREAGQRGAAFLASASSLDGSFGLNGHTPRNPLTGGLAGLVKTASHEWPEVACKSLDISHDHHDAAALAELIAEELLLKGPTEVGISSSGLCETRLVRKSLNGEVGKTSLTADDVVVVTGGARGVTAAVSIALAKEYQCKLLLLGRSAAPGVEDAWLAGLSSEAEIKKAIASHLKGSATPRAVEEQYRRVMADREVRATLSQIEAAGAKVIYRSLDVRDAAAVSDAINDARKNVGPIRGIIHGAGVLQDRLIEHKTPEQFDEVFSTKVGGFNSLLQAVKNDDLKVIVAFSSTTGRFGRKGQVAYAAANEVLNKLAQQEAHQRPKCRVLSMNWGPWEGGMVTPQLRRVFESEGVGLIPLQAGADYLVREMSTPAGGPVEILILGPLGSAGHSNGASTNGRANGAAKHHAALSTVAFEREVSIESHPVLKSHVIKGKAVVPAALMVEWLAHGAMHENPGLLFHGFEEFRVLKGITLERGRSVTVQVLTAPAVHCDGFEVVSTELRSGGTVHARAMIVLASQLPHGKASGMPAANRAYSSGKDAIYSDGRLFHGKGLQAIRSVAGWSEEGIVAEIAAAASPAAWMKQPLRSGWIADPLAIDAAFQLMILWCFETRGVGSLPTAVGNYRQFVRAFPQSGVRIGIRVLQASEHSATAAIEFTDHAGNLLARMDGYECVMDATLQESFALNQLAD
ncbi:MAG TPA: SDR family NAD(P)-dependent oxidoreductase [Phycisphaerae bacterium]|nr:SDR family NAD(P)-dependent oxidoreductase [Phycisphaerae bacterium]